MLCSPAWHADESSRQSVVPPSDVMDLIVLMVLIGMDPGTTKGNALGIRTAIESLGKLVAASQVSGISVFFWNGNLFIVV
jgi:hypothetical protein